MPSGLSICATVSSPTTRSSKLVVLRTMSYLIRIVIFLLCAVLAQIGAKAYCASTSKPWHDELESEWGGQFKTTGTVSWPDDESYLQPGGTDTFYDGSLDFRLKHKVFFANRGYFETHYEAVAFGGDTWRKKKELEQTYPHLFENGILFGGQLNDDRRLLDLTKTISETNNTIIYHRLDRLVLTLLPKWGAVRMGRQALTWGNGLLFNPMDLFNPFAPTDIERDYKVGDDMAVVNLPMKTTGDLQMLYVPRRNPIDNNLESDQSSLAGKLHVAVGTTEFDVMTAKHYKDFVVGLGSRGYLMEATWRLDATYTFLDDNSNRDGFFSLVSNLDYSWVWLEKNFYGLVEFYYNGLGSDQYSEALEDSNVIDRLARGELFTLGRKYLSGEIQVELHPLFNFYLTVINNLADPSGIIQPRAVWDMMENVQLTFGANISYGGTDTEYGGFKTSQTDFLIKHSDNTFIWATYFF